ncbi:MAG TPA: SPOR domain-containing protein [bacterium]|nr:SPOR domain-containing protein [bacterium]HPN41887.1 SPOR domain-containing protein [bacterium]
MNGKKLIILCMGLVLTGYLSCSGPAQLQNGSTPVQQQQHEQQTRLNEEFDPLTLNDEPVSSSETIDAKAEFFQLSEFITTAVQDTADINEMAPGYRVQLISTRSESESNMVKLDAMLTFQTHVYRIFDDPYYKIRIGDCLSRFEANELQETAVKKGFSEAWVVQTNVYRNVRPVEEKQ